MDSESNQQFLWFLIILILLMFAGAVFFFGKDLSKDQPASINEPKNHNGRIYTVFYTSGVFSPTNLQINVGDTVRFLNESILSVRIKADDESDLPGFDSISEIPPTGVFTFTFATRGIFDYHNEIKPKQKGTIIVK